VNRTAFFLVALLWSEGIAAPLVTQPCDLKGTCKLVDPSLLVDYYGSGKVKLVDSSGRELVFLFFDDKVYFKSGEGTKIESQRGSREEQCLLKTLKESFAAVYDPAFDKLDPAFDKDTGGAGAKRYQEQRAVKHFILVLERRCAAKSHNA
jgi:hypothetical protein